MGLIVESNDSQRKWKCLCDCGQFKILNSHLLTSGHTASCGCLRSEKVSRREVFIAKYFKDNNILYETQKMFSDCNGLTNKPLRFDFYLPNLNTLIEYDGRQHFKPSK